MRTRRLQGRPKAVLGLLGIAGGMLLLSAASAFAYWQTSDSSHAAAALGATLAAPTGGAQAGTATPSSIPISWTAPAGYTPTGYIVLRCTGSSCTPSSSPSVGGCSQVITLVVTATSCTDSDTSLAAGTTYTYEVEAVLDNWVSTPGTSFHGATTAISKLVFTTQPAAGANIQAKGTGSFSVSVSIEDSNGAVDTNDSTDTVTLGLGTNPTTGSVLSCTNAGGLTVTASGGVASFTGCAITLTGTGYKLTASSATSPSLSAPANANAFNIVAGTASQLTFTTQPSSGQNIQAKGTGSFPVTVSVEDANGNVETGDSSTSVTLSLGTNPTTGSVLACTNTGGLTVTDSAGVANFTGCSITLVGTGYKLTASSSPSLSAPANANAFNIVAGTASQLTFTTQPSSGQNIEAAGSGSFPVTVAVEDQNGNPTSDSGRSVTLSLGTNPTTGSVLACTNTGGLTVTDSGGTASFTGCSITLVGTGYKLTAAATGLSAPANANAFNIIGGAPAYIGFTDVTVPVTGATPVNCPVPAVGTHTTACTFSALLGLVSYTAEVELFDQNGNPATNTSNVTVNLSAGGVSSVSVPSLSIASGSNTSTSSFMCTLGLGGLGVVTANATVSSTAFSSTITPQL